MSYNSRVRPSVKPFKNQMTQRKVSGSATTFRCVFVPEIDMNLCDRSRQTFTRAETHMRRDVMSYCMLKRSLRDDDFVMTLFPSITFSSQ